MTSVSSDGGIYYPTPGLNILAVADNIQFYVIKCNERLDQERLFSSVLMNYM